MSLFHIRDHMPAGGLPGTMLAENLQRAEPGRNGCCSLASVSLFLATHFPSSAIVQTRFHFVSVLAESWIETKSVKTKN
jgi:hypothetical protein